MAQSADELIAAALALPSEERKRMVDVLYESLDDVDRDADLSPELRETIARRIGEIERGEVQTIPAEEVFREIEQDLALREKKRAL
jgi:putative addiction module component (TIGR02574 family)